MRTLAFLAEIAGFLLVMAGFWVLHPALLAIVAGLLLVGAAQVVDGGGER